MENVSKMGNYLSNIIFGRSDSVEFKSKESLKPHFSEDLNNAKVQKELLLISGLTSEGTALSKANSSCCDLDNIPILLGDREITQATCSVAQLVNSMLNMLLEYENSSIYVNAKILFFVMYLLKEIDKYQNIPSNSAAKDLYGYKNTPYYFPIFILSLNLVEQIKKVKVKTFDYKKEKKKILKKIEEQNKKEKERKADFAASFQFGIN